MIPSAAAAAKMTFEGNSITPVLASTGSLLKKEQNSAYISQITFNVFLKTLKT